MEFFCCIDQSVRGIGTAARLGKLFSVGNIPCSANLVEKTRFLPFMERHLQWRLRSALDASLLLRIVTG
jgi:hypothetical protein